MEITFEDPPEHGNTKHDHEAVAAALKERPGEWAIGYYNANSSIAAQIKRGQLAAFHPEGSFEAVTRGRDRGSNRAAKIYVRYIGENGEYA